jgi:hypothetical protein
MKNLFFPDYITMDMTVTKTNFSPVFSLKMLFLLVLCMAAPILLG